MGALTFFRIAKRLPGLNKHEDLPHLETLIEEEALKIKDGYQYARWITPLTGALFAFACFMPLALTVNPLFWIGTAGMLLIGGGLGLIFHMLDKAISPTEKLLRSKLYKLSMRFNALRNILGVMPVLSPKVAKVLEEAATLYLRSRPASDQQPQRRSAALWDDAQSKAERAMEEAMVQMLSLAELETPQAQEVELGRGWAQTLLEEMKATAHAIETHKQTVASGTMVAPQMAPLASLRDARADLERLETAVNELEQVVQNR